MKHLRDITVLVLGLGDSGLAMARWCARSGARVRVWDSRAVPPQAGALAVHVPAARLLDGPLGDAAFEGVQLVLRSPGLSPADPRIAAPLERAADTGVLVQGELDLFARALADLKAERGYVPRLIAITGTNGKTTTTAMAAQLIARAGRRVAMAGNIGPTMLQTLAEALDREPEPAAAALAAPMGSHRAAAAGGLQATTAQAASAALPSVEEDGTPEAGRADTDETDEPGHADPDPDPDLDPGPNDDDLDDLQRLDGTTATLDVAAAALTRPSAPAAPVFEHLPEVWVLELSSFQLHDAEGFEPDAATVLNLTQDHLDWHGNMAAYTAAKARAFGKYTMLVINRDDPQVERLVPEPVPAKGRLARPAAGQVVREVLRFGLGPPLRPGDYGVVESNGMAWLVRALHADPTPRRGKRGVAEEEELHLQHLMPADALRVRGRHNAANALAALALATAIGCPLAPMLHALRDYRCEPHRVQHVATVGGVDVFDDSKGTNVGATVAALHGLGADKAPGRLVVILGGQGKGQDFAPLLAPVRHFARAVATVGVDAQAIEAALAQAGVSVQRHDSLQAATRWCFEQARPGDAVLLSPACASLDMFRDYGHRAQVFLGEVQQLAAERGETGA